MRSRPAMTVLLRPGVPRPGETLEVEAGLVSSSETPVDRITFELAGVETVRVQRGKSHTTWSRSHLHLRAEHEGTTLTPGSHSYRARFNLPAGIPPAYLGRYARITYTLEVCVDIPWWPDRVGRYDVPVAPWPVSAQAAPGIFVSERGGARSGELYSELSLATTVLEPGGEITGTLAFTNLAQARLRGAHISLVAYERLFADAGFFEGGSIRESREVLRHNYALKSAPQEGAGIPFRFRVTKGTVPSYTGAISALDWAVEVVQEGLILDRPLLRVPIQILPPSGASAPRATPSAPAVGRERRARSFQRVGEQAALAYDAERDELRGAIGAVEIRIAVETRPDGATATAAHLSWPHLGMGLRLSPGAWTDALAAREINVGDAEFDAAFQVRGRFAEQVSALLDEELRRALMQFNEARADDDGAHCAVNVALIEEEAIGKFVALATRTARAFNAGIARVPLPAPLAGAAEAWRELSERLGGRFEAGRCAIHDATFGSERVAITTLWTDEGELRGAGIRSPFGVRVDPDAAPPAARELAASLEKLAGGRVTLSADEVTLTVERRALDPLEIEPLLEGVTRLVRAARGRGAAGPFRS